MGLAASSVWAEPVSQGGISKVNKKREHDEDYVAQNKQNYPSEEATIWHVQHGVRRKEPLDWELSRKFIEFCQWVVELNCWMLNFSAF